jgi:hypothetical protein
MIAMPEPDRAVLGRRAEIVEALRRLVPGEGVIDKQNELRAFECDVRRIASRDVAAPGDDGAGRRHTLLRGEQNLVVRAGPGRRSLAALSRSPTVFSLA